MSLNTGLEDLMTPVEMNPERVEEECVWMALQFCTDAGFQALDGMMILPVGFISWSPHDLPRSWLAVQEGGSFVGCHTLRQLP